MRYFVTLDGVEHEILVDQLPNGSYDVRSVPAGGGAPVALEIDVVARPGLLNLRVGGKVIDLVVDGEPPDLHVFASGRRAKLSVESQRMRTAAQVRGSAAGSSDGLVSSPMPGKVVKVLVKQGDAVEIGSPLVVVEAMKMENELAAERAGVVEQVFVNPGDAVEGGARLVSIS